MYRDQWVFAILVAFCTSCVCVCVCVQYKTNQVRTSPMQVYEHTALQKHNTFQISRFPQFTGLRIYKYVCVI